MAPAARPGRARSSGRAPRCREPARSRRVGDRAVRSAAPATRARAPPSAGGRSAIQRLAGRATQQERARPRRRPARRRRRVEHEEQPARAPPAAPARRRTPVSRRRPAEPGRGGAHGPFSPIGAARHGGAGTTPTGVPGTPDPRRAIAEAGEAPETPLRQGAAVMSTHQLPLRSATACRALERHPPLARDPRLVRLRRWSRSAWRSLSRPSRPNDADYRIGESGRADAHGRAGRPDSRRHRERPRHRARGRRARPAGGRAASRPADRAPAIEALAERGRASPTPQLEPERHRVAASTSSSAAATDDVGALQRGDRRGRGGPPRPVGPRRPAT